MGKKIAEGPPRLNLSEIDMGMVEQAQKLRAKGMKIPVSRQAIEYVRYLRANGVFDGDGYYRNGGYSAEAEQPPDLTEN